MDRGAVPDETIARELEHFFNQAVDGKRLQAGFPVLEQGSQSPDDLARPLVFAHDVRENLAGLGEIGRLLREETLRRLGVGEDDGQRLVQLVRERARQLAHRGDPGKVGQFLVLAAGPQLRPVCVR